MRRVCDGVRGRFAAAAVTATMVGAAALASSLAGQMITLPTAATQRTAPIPAPTTRPIDDPTEQLPTTRPAQRPAPPAADEVQRARKQIWNEFRAEYDKDSESDRSALGHKLLQLALQPQSSGVSRWALLHEARELAADARDERLALKAAEAAAFYFDVDAASEKLKALSAGRWPAESEESARAVLDDWLGLCDEATAAGNFDVAGAAADGALRVAEHWGDEQWVKTASARQENVRRARQERERLDAAMKTLSAHPDDPKAAAIVGARDAVAGDWDKALALLRNSADPVVKLAATADLQKPKGAAALISMAEDWAGAAERQPPDVAEAFRKRARHWYQAVLPLVPQKDREEIRRRIKALPGGNIFQTIAESSDSPRHVQPIGGKGGGAFSETSTAGALLNGVRITVGPVYGNPCISSIQPLFRTASGKVEGTVHGKQQGNAMTVEARDGYAVAGFVMKTGWAVDGFKVVFMRIKDDALDPGDRYESPWYGGRGGGAETPLGCDGQPIIGLEGRAGDGLDALGIAQVP